MPCILARVRALLVVLLLAGCAAPAPLGPPATDAPAWIALAAAPTPRTEVAVAASDAEFFVLGGFVEDGAVVTTVEVYDAASDGWHAAPDLPLALHHHAAVAVDGTVYVFGGFVHPPVPVGAGAVVLPVVTDAAWKLAPGGTSWQAVAALPAPRAAGGAAVVDGRVVLVGGLGRDLELLDAVHVYDPAADAWAEAAPLPTPRDHLGVAALDGKVYAAAGQELSHAASVQALEVYDPATDAWSTLPPNPTARNSVSAAAWDGKVVVLGGQDAERTYADVEAYDPATEAWTALPPMPTARHGFGAGAWDGRLYALLGGPEPGLSVTGAVEALSAR